MHVRPPLETHDLLQVHNKQQPLHSHLQPAYEQHVEAENLPIMMANFKTAYPLFRDFQ